jgi:hypothetical protein
MRFGQLAILSQPRGFGPTQPLARTRGRKHVWLKVGGIGFEPEDVRPESDCQVRRSARAVEFGLALRE